MESFTLEVDALGKLTLKRPGQEDAADVRIRRAFPWSVPGRYISVRSPEGKELLLIEDLQEVEAAQRTLIEAYLQKWAFIPRIQQVHEVVDRFGVQCWKVLTDRGEVEFRVQEREDIRFLNDGRFSIKDVDGCIYELPPLDQLDDKSRAAVEVLV